MKIQEERARKKMFRSFALSKIRKRNAVLEHLCWIRNAPKLLFCKAFEIIRAALLEIQDELIQNNHLEKTGDIFHLTMIELDAALSSSKNSNLSSLKKIIKERRAIHEQALKANVCPMLVDSRCRILKPDVKIGEPGTVIGHAVSPGVATGRVRIVQNPITDPLETGEVLVAVVTDPSWTPLFVSASAVILQIGGTLQHGALCAREYGKPAVSGIEIMENFKTGMMVSVDGNTGVVKIL